MFYLFNFFFVLYSLFLYTWFRCGIYDYLRVSGRSKTYIHKNRKGMKTTGSIHNCTRNVPSVCGIR